MSDPIPFWEDSEDRDAGKAPDYYLCPDGVHSMFDFCPGYDICTGVDDDE